MSAITADPNDIGSLTYWLRKNQVLRIGNHDVKITIMDTAPGRVQLKMEVRKELQIRTEMPLHVSNKDKLNA